MYFDDELQILKCIQLHVYWKTLSYFNVQKFRKTKQCGRLSKKITQQRKKSCRTFCYGTIGKTSPISKLNKYLIEDILHIFLRI